MEYLCYKCEILNKSVDCVGVYTKGKRLVVICKSCYNKLFGVN